MRFTMTPRFQSMLQLVNWFDLVEISWLLMMEKPDVNELMDYPFLEGYLGP